MYQFSLMLLLLLKEGLKILKFQYDAFLIKLKMALTGKKIGGS